MNITLRASFLRPAASVSKLVAPSSASPSYVSHSCRRYHSYQHPPPSPSTPFSPAESAILSAALLHIPSYGFSNATLSLGARDAGYLDISVNLLPRGVFDLVCYHLATERLRLGQKMNFRESGALQAQGEGMRSLGVSARIRSLCMERLKANTPIIHWWQEALAIMSLAENIPASVSELVKLSDEIWFLAGDESYDTTWYTKRATLSGVYASTELFMTQDNSKDFKATWEFLDRGLDGVETVGTAISNITSYLDFTAHAFTNVLRSKNFPFFEK